MAFGSQLNGIFGAQKAIVLLGEQSTISAAGTNQATATAITTANCIVGTVAAGSGVVLPGSTVVSANDRVFVMNAGANTLACYPPSGGTLNNAAANVPALIAPGKCVDFYCRDGTNYAANLGA